MRAVLLFVLAFSVHGASPTFYGDVLPILEQHCQSCHRPGEAAPMPLLNYESTRPWAKAIKQAVITRKMPPWFADPSIGHFANDRTLPESAIETISKWVDAGAPEGEARHDEITPKFVDGWTIGNPDLIFEMPAGATIPATGTQPYQYVIVPTHFERDTWVRLAEARAGDREHSHHIVISVREPGSPWLRKDPIGVPFVTRPGDDDGFASAGEFLTGYGPGSIPEMLSKGQAKLIKAGSDLVFQLHYTTNGKASTDRSRVGLILAKDPPHERVLMLAAANVRFQIPPGEPDFIAEARIKLYQDSTLVSLLPHMHLRGKSFEFSAIYPDGRKETLLRVPHYDFDWQLSYYLDHPKTLPAGTVIACVARYDNSANNARNPDPTKTVRFGDQDWDEMMIGYFEVAVAPKLDARAILVRP